MKQGWGLVLSGGGTKGSYHIGVWEALRDLNIPISGICGTSIGSVNGALFCQGDLEVARKIWKNISIDQVVDTSHLEQVEGNLFAVKNVPAIVGEAYKNNGLDMQPFQNLLMQYIDEDKIRKSPIDFGLVTCRLPDLSTVQLFKEEIPKGKLVDYLMASASLPGFQAKKIDDQAFVDGGVRNNMPVDMLIGRGYQNLITVDVGALGVMKGVDKTGRNVVEIRCDDAIIGMMEFDQAQINRSIKKGYLDTYRAFGRLTGKKYYFNVGDYHKNRMQYSAELLEGLEYAATAFGIDALKVYRVEDLIEGVLRGYQENVQKTKEQDGFFENFMRIKYADKVIVARLAKIIRTQNLDFMANKIIMNVLGNNFLAAHAVAYFLGCQDVK